MSSEDSDWTDKGKQWEDAEPNQSERKSTNSVSCKICFDAGKDEDPITPCLCKGTIGCVHLSCLEKWLEMTNGNTCELCRFTFNLTRRPRYPVAYSVYFWLCKEKGDNYQNKHALVDLIVFLLIAPIFGLFMWICVAFASVSETVQMNTKKHRIFWAPLILTAAACFIGFALYLWTIVGLNSHCRSWYKWWQSKNVVRVHYSGTAPSLPHLRPIFIETSFV